MSEPKWTPGPWRAVNLDDDTIFPSVVLHEVANRRPARLTINEGPSREMIQAGGDYGGTTMETASANARLIAAAPELYAALIAVSDMLYARPDIIFKLAPLMGPAERAVCDAATAALAKARGEP